MTFITAEAALVTPDTVSVAVKRCTPSGKAAVTKLQAPLAIRRRRAEQRRPVVDIHRAVRHRGAGQRQDRRIGNAVADNARVRRERGDGRGSRRRRNCHRQGRRRRPGIAGRIARRRRQAVRSRSPALPWYKLQAPLPLATALPNSVAPSKTLTVAFASAVPVSVRTFVVGDPVTNGARIGRERGDARRRRCHRVDRDVHRGRSRTGHARHRVGRGETMQPVRQGSCDKAPGPACIGRRRAEQRRTVVDIHRAVCDRRAGQRQDRRIGNAVADNARIRRERGDGRGSRRRRNCYRQGRRRRPGIAGCIGCRRGKAMSSIGQGARGEAPGPAAIGHRAAQQRRAVKDLDRCVRLRRTRQRQDIRSW